MTQLYKFFPTTVITDKVDAYTQDVTLNKVLSYLERPQSSDLLSANQQENLYTTYHCDKDIIEYLELFELQNYIFHMVYLMCEHLKIKRNKEDFAIYSWLNKFEKNQSEGGHMHTPSFLSGVYYVKAESESGFLTFSDPNPIRILWSQMNCQEIVNVDGEKVQAETGKIVIFPSWQYHHVTKNNSDLRLSIAYNVDYRRE